MSNLLRRPTQPPFEDSPDKTLEHIDKVREKGGYDTWGTRGVRTPGEGFRHLTQGGVQLGRSPGRACLRPCASASTSLPGLLPARYPGSRSARETPVSQAAPGSVRLAQMRSAQRARAEKEQELDQAFSAPPQWWQSAQAQQRSAQLALWAQQAFSKDALENLALALPPLADEAARHGRALPEP